MRIPVRVTLLPVVLAVSLLGACAANAAAEGAPVPALTIKAVTSPTVFSPAFNGNEELPDDYTVTVTNTGSEPTSGPFVIDDELPAGITAASLYGTMNEVKEEAGSGLPFGFPRGARPIIGPVPTASCEVATLECTYDFTLLPGQRVYMVIAVTVAPGAVGPVTDSAVVSGGGAPSASTNVTTAIGSEAQSGAEPFGLAAVSAEATGLNGLTDAQAGDHPYETTVSFSLNTVDHGNEKHGGQIRYPTAGTTRDVVVDVPPGFVGDPTVVPRCPQYDLPPEQCPPDALVGYARLTIIGRSFNEEGTEVEGFPVYNVAPQKGYPAEFAIIVRPLSLAVPLYVSVTPDSNYGVRIVTPEINEFGSATDVSVTFFGTPATDPNFFDEYRTAVHGAAPVAFLDNPVDCSTAPQETTVSVDSWQDPAPWRPDGQPELNDPRWVSKSATQFSSLTGCELLQFNPSLTVTPDTTRADEPAGTTVDVHVPQAPQQFPALVTPPFKDTTVTLPAGLSISPSAGDGLEGCSDAQIALSVASVGSCPDGSQIGTVKVTTPLLTEPLEGQVFLGTPNCDPCSNADAADGNMYRIFLQFEGSGTIVKQEGHIYANTTTGQLTTTFTNTPQLPVSDVQLHFNGGLRAALATPQSCGTFASTADITPYSSPITPDATPFSQFNVDWDGNGGACPSTMPFAPSFSAGTSNPNAGQFSPFTLTFGREDREQDLDGIQVHMPPGLLGSLTGIPLCGETQAALGTCAAGSRIGTMTVAAGPGSHPFYEQGQIYLTGPYAGAPFGLSIVVPTVAGPYNFGNVVVRAKISIDPVTAALTVTSDPFPQILDGVPLRLRTANVTIERPNFIFNPTNCAQQHVTASIASAQGTQANVSAPFAVSGCAGLHFGPTFKVSTAGKTSKAGGASLDAKVTFPTGAQSNIAYVKVDLPKQLPSRLTTLQKACTAKQFEANPAGCPAASVIGIAKATTPLLPVPLTGPAIFVSHGGEAFPSLVVILQGYGVRVDLTAATFISHQGITSSTFKTIPDVPVNSFELYLPEGKYSALAANGNLCTSKLTMPTLFTAQDGSQFKQSTKLTATGCPKAGNGLRRDEKKAKAKKANEARKAGNDRRVGR